jgi:formylmethanofuran dehydrogenase subunit E
VLLDDTLENYLKRVAEFHGCFLKAPGIVIGCHMVDYAMEALGDIQGTLSAVSETRVCLTDCIQVMTGCTLGNKRLKVHDYMGRYACTLYDRDTKRGVRVFLDLSKIDRTQSPELYAFHTRQRDPRVLTDMRLRKESGHRVVDEFMKQSRNVLSCEHVVVQLPAKEPMLPSIPCGRCGEPFLTAKTAEVPVCPACLGQTYYQPLADTEREPVSGEVTASCKL